MMANVPRVHLKRVGMLVNYHSYDNIVIFTEHVVSLLIKARHLISNILHQG